VSRQGWLCPVCGFGVAPHVERCPSDRVGLGVDLASGVVDWSGFQVVRNGAALS
jgi:hypothetical protein